MLNNLIISDKLKLNFQNIYDNNQFVSSIDTNIAISFLTFYIFDKTDRKENITFSFFKKIN